MPTEYTFKLLISSSHLHCLYIQCQWSTRISRYNSWDLVRTLHQIMFLIGKIRARGNVCNYTSTFQRLWNPYLVAQSIEVNHNLQLCFRGRIDIFFNMLLSMKHFNKYKNKMVCWYHENVWLNRIRNEKRHLIII